MVLPGALPSIFVGLRFALGVMWLTLIVAETIAAQSGVGYMAMQAREFMMTDVVVLSILIYALLGKLADVVVRALERAFLPWHPAFSGADGDGCSPPRGSATRRVAFEAARGASITARGLAKSVRRRSRCCAASTSTCPPGQFVAVVGRSGCGKSTLLRLLAGLDAPTQGASPSATGPRPIRASIARVMFQEPRLLPWARVLANVEVGLGADRRSRFGPRRGRSKRSQSVGLADRAEDWPSVLSGGQKQRVALARALVSRPRFLALDEPLGALDALTRIEMQRLIEAAWRREGFTAVLVTHDVAEAVALADRIVLIEQGAIALDVARRRCPARAIAARRGSARSRSASSTACSARKRVRSCGESRRHFGARPGARRSWQGHNVSNRLSAQICHIFRIRRNR